MRSTAVVTGSTIFLVLLGCGGGGAGGGTGTGGTVGSGGGSGGISNGGGNSGFVGRRFSRWRRDGQWWRFRRGRCRGQWWRHGEWRRFGRRWSYGSWRRHGQRRCFGRWWHDWLERRERSLLCRADRNRYGLLAVITLLDHASADGRAGRRQDDAEQHHRRTRRWGVHPDGASGLHRGRVAVRSGRRGSQWPHGNLASRGLCSPGDFGREEDHGMGTERHRQEDLEGHRA